MNDFKTKTCLINRPDSHVWVSFSEVYNIVHLEKNPCVTICHFLIHTSGLASVDANKFMKTSCSGAHNCLHPSYAQAETSIYLVKSFLENECLQPTHFFLRLNCHNIKKCHKCQSVVMKRIGIRLAAKNLVGKETLYPALLKKPQSVVVVTP